MVVECGFRGRYCPAWEQDLCGCLQARAGSAGSHAQNGLSDRRGSCVSGAAVNRRHAVSTKHLNCNTQPLIRRLAEITFHLTQRLQYPLIKECSLNHIRDPTIM